MSQAKGLAEAQKQKNEMAFFVSTVIGFFFGFAFGFFIFIVSLNTPIE